MPELSDEKLTLYDLDKLTVEERTEALKPIVKANTKQFTELANNIGKASELFKSVSSLTESLKFPLSDIFNNLKLPEIPQMPDIMSNRIDLTELPSFERYDPPVVIKKSKWEIEKEEREAYMTELQIEILENQLNIYKGMLAPQYEQNTGIITFLGKKIEIPLNTNLEMVCRIVLKNSTNMKRKWSWDEIVELNRENVGEYNSRKIYTAIRSINEKVALETQTKDFLISKPTSTVQLNPIFLAK